MRTTRTLGQKYLKNFKFIELMSHFSQPQTQMLEHAELNEEKLIYEKLRASIMASKNRNIDSKKKSKRKRDDFDSALNNLISARLQKELGDIEDRLRHSISSKPTTKRYFDLDAIDYSEIDDLVHLFCNP